MSYNISLNINKSNNEVNILKYSNNYLADNNLFIATIGNMYNINGEKISLEKIKELYLKHNYKINDFLDGNYSLIIFDKNKNKIFIFQDYFGNNQSIYYYISDKNIYISNELKEIISNNNIYWKFNKKGINYFLDRGYIPNSMTLVKNISKVPGLFNIEIDLKKNKVKKYKNDLDRKKISVNNQIYNDTLKNICSSLMLDDKVGATISSGYDTNYILYFLSSMVKKIDTFCVGGKIGRNEIPVAAEICKSYKNVKFDSAVVDDKSLLNYPEIVWALEGSIFECGIFLQYALSNLVHSHKIENMVCGECADQVLNYDLYHRRDIFFDSIKYNLKRKLRKIFTGDNQKPFKDIYEMASYKILKKNGILMNYYNINSHYPYIRKPFVLVASNIVKKGDTNKTFHKMVIKEKLSKENFEKLKKIGGTTDLNTLFIGDISFEKLKKICKNSPFYKNKKFKDKIYETDYVLKIVYLELFKKIFLNDIKKYYKGNFKYNLLYFFPELGE